MTQAFRNVITLITSEFISGRRQNERGKGSSKSKVQSSSVEHHLSPSGSRRRITVRGAAAQECDRPGRSNARTANRIRIIGTSGTSYDAAPGDGRTPFP